MKKILVLFTILCVGKLFSQVPQKTTPIEVPATYANHLGEPISVKKDSLYVFRTADVFLVNKKSFLAIKNVYQSTVNTNEMTEQLIEKYTETLHKNIDLERKLNTNFAATDSLDLQVYQKMKTTLANTEKALEYTVNSLEKATNSLELVEKASKQQRKKTFFEKLLIGMAGVGAGILVGVSL